METHKVSSADAIRGHTFYARQPDGTLAPVTFQIGKERLILSVANGEALRGYVNCPKLPAASVAAPPAQAESPRPNTTQEKGSEKTQRDMQLFKPEIPCWFQGCVELRQKYLEAINAPGCTDCNATALMRSYLVQMEQIDTRPG